MDRDRIGNPRGNHGPAEGLAGREGKIDINGLQGARAGVNFEPQPLQGIGAKYLGVAHSGENNERARLPALALDSCFANGSIDWRPLNRPEMAHFRGSMAEAREGPFSHPHQEGTGVDNQVEFFPTREVG